MKNKYLIAGTNFLIAGISMRLFFHKFSQFDNPLKGILSGSINTESTANSFVSLDLRSISAMSAPRKASNIFLSYNSE